MKRSKRRSKLGIYNKKDIIFYVALIALPVLQFVIFYIFVNANSFALAFKEYDTASGTSKWVGFDNIKQALWMMTHGSELYDAMRTSFLGYFIGLLIGTPLALLFSYYIYKALPGHRFFRVMLFMPSIISSIVIVTIFQFFADRALPEIMTKWFHVETFRGLTENPDTRFGTVMFYNIFVSFGVSVLMYSDAMGKIPPELTEATRLEGVTGIKEFIYVTFQMIYPTFSTFIITGVAGIFTNQFNLFSFFGEGSTIQTFGYWIYVKSADVKSQSDYPVIASVGLILTLIALPLTMIVRKLLERIGPSTE